MTGGAYSAGSGEFYTTMMRVDKNEPKVVSMMGSGGGRMHYMRDSLEYAEKFKSGTSVILKTKGWKSETKIIKFDLKGFTKAYAAVSKSCK